MSGISTENLNNYIASTVNLIEKSIPCAEGKVVIDISALSNIEKVNALIDKVVAETYSDKTKPNYFIKDIAFISYFLKMFTNFPVPLSVIDDESIINIQSTYNMVIALNLRNNILLIPEVRELYDYVDKQIVYENSRLIACASQSVASDEAAETVSYMAHKVLEG